MKAAKAYAEEEAALREEAAAVQLSDKKEKKVLYAEDV